MVIFARYVIDLDDIMNQRRLILLIVLINLDIFKFSRRHSDGMKETEILRHRHSASMIILFCVNMPPKQPK